MFVERTQNLCAITIEQIQEVCDKYPEFLNKHGEPNIPLTLFALGVKVDFEDYNWGVRVTEDVYVRNRLIPDLAYKTTIYAGKARKLVKEVIIDAEDGLPILIWDDEFAAAKAIFDKIEIMSPSNLTRYVSEDRMKSVSEIGSLRVYRKFIAKAERQHEINLKKGLAVAPESKAHTRGTFTPAEGYTVAEWKDRRYFEAHSDPEQAMNLYEDLEKIRNEGGGTECWD